MTEGAAIHFYMKSGYIDSNGIQLYYETMGEGEPLLGRDDAVAQARVIEALYHSAEAGEAVHL